MQRLIYASGLKEEDVSIWLDWQSIPQDDRVEKSKGVLSLIAYASMCSYMLAPTDVEKAPAHVHTHVDRQDAAPMSEPRVCPQGLV